MPVLQPEVQLIISVSAMNRSIFDTAIGEEGPYSVLFYWLHCEGRLWLADVIPVKSWLFSA